MDFMAFWRTVWDRVDIIVDIINIDFWHPIRPAVLRIKADLFVFQKFIARRSWQAIRWSWRRAWEWFWEVAEAILTAWSYVFLSSAIGVAFFSCVICWMVFGFDLRRVVDSVLPRARLLPPPSYTPLLMPAL